METTEDCEQPNFIQEFNYSSKNLYRFPEQIISGRTVTAVNLNYNNLREIPSAVCEALSPTLMTFRVKGNRIKTLPETIGTLVHLKLLDISENALQELPRSFSSLMRLETLKLIANKLKFLPEDIDNMVCLRHVYLDENELLYLPATFGQLQQLDTLEVCNNKLKGLPMDIGGMSQLRCINASYNKIQELPESMQNCASVEEMDLSHNRIKFLPICFASAGKLRTLYINENCLCVLPNWFDKLYSLEELGIEDNFLQKAALPDVFGDSSKKLKYFSLAGNYLQSLPSTFGLLTKLEFVHLGSVLHELERRNFQNGNWISILPNNFGLLTSLTHLRLDENQLIELPESFGEMTNLETLDLGQNNLKKLPDSFSKLSSLKTCLLSKNFLEYLPWDFGKLRNLTELRLDNNLLFELPESFGNFIKLKILDLFNNQLASVPLCLQHLVNLQYLELDENKFEIPLAEIPKIIFSATYAPRNSDFKDNWRGKNRQTGSEDIMELKTVEENAKISSNEQIRTLTKALKQGSMYWQFHNSTKPREKFVRANVRKQEYLSPGKLVISGDRNKSEDVNETSSSSASSDTEKIYDNWDENDRDISINIDNLAVQDDDQVQVMEQEDWDKEMNNSNPFHSYDCYTTYRHRLATSLYNQPYSEDTFCPAIYHAKSIPRFFCSYSAVHAESNGQFDDAD